MKLSSAALALLAVSADAAERKLQTSSAMSTSQAEPLQMFYMPLPEEDVFHDMFREINSRKKSNGQYWVRGDMISLVSVAVSTDNTVLWVDHSEDGYDDDVLNAPSATTEVWGDGNCSNGFRPDIEECVDGPDSNDSLNAGDSFVIETKVPLPRDTSDFLIDGGDKFQASYPVAITRGEYAEYPGSLLAGAVEVHDTSDWGKSYETPVGTDTQTTTHAFEYSRLFIMSGTDGNEVMLPGSDSPVILNEGESTSVSVKQGDKVTATHDIQVDLCTGDVGSNYELRWFSLIPTEDWSDKYMSPVGDDFGRTKLVLYNPNAASITIDFTWLEDEVETSESYTLEANEKQYSRIVPTGSGAIAESPGNKFIALSMTDTERRAGTNSNENQNERLNGQAFDWGFPVVPYGKLTQQVLVGWGYGCTANDCEGKTERSAVWVSPKEDADVWVDYQNTGENYEEHNMKRLQSKMIRDTTDHDMSGAVIFATKAGTGPQGDPVDIAAAWGQDPSVSRAVQKISLDLGTVVNPFTSIKVGKLVDKPTASAGDTLTYTIMVQNVGQNLLRANSFSVTDNLPAEVNYVEGSATCSADGGVSFIPIDDDTSGTPFPFDESGYILDKDLPRRGGTAQFRFQVTIDPTKVGDKEQIVNTGFVTPPLGPDQPFSAVTKVVPDGETKTGTKDPVDPPEVGPPICMQEVYNNANNNNDKLICRKDEMFFEEIKATGRDSCRAGSTIKLSLVGSIRVKSGHNDIGYYLATDGGDALTGTCHRGALEKGKEYRVHENLYSNEVLGHVTYRDGDDCGDLELSALGGANIRVVDLLENTEVKCVDSNKDGSLDISVCFTWRGDSNNNICNLNTGLFPADTETCYCRKYQIPQITVIRPDEPQLRQC